MKEAEITNPYDDSVVGKVKVTTASEVEKALAVADELHRQNRHGLSPHLRIKILKKTADIMRGRMNGLANMIAAEGGKPLIDARIEVERAIDGVEICAAEIGQNNGKEIPMGLTPAAENKVAFTTREPIGLVLAISAFNHPLNLIVHQVGPAVAAGCPVIVKPAEDTPLSCLTFIKILHEAGLPGGWAQFVYCDAELAQKLVTDSRVRFFSFIGSARVGWKLRSLLAPGARLALEHGGAAPVIVGASANVENLIPKIAKGGFYHSGQVCVSVQRIYSLGGKAATLAERLAVVAKKLVVGNAIEEATECGPLIRNREVERVANWVDEAVAAGAKLITGGKKLSESCYEPTVLLNPPVNARVSAQEIFGPVICVYDTPDIDMAINLSNSLPFAFQASVFSNDLNETMKAYHLLDASAVIINDHSAFRVDWMPFSGRRQSGYGIGGIGYTLEDMTQIKMGVFSTG